MNKKPTQMRKSTKLFFSGALILTLSNIIIKIIGMLFKVPMNHFIGDTGMGYYGSAYTIYTFLYMISTAGLPVAVSILISDARAKCRLKQIKRILNITLMLFFAIGFIGTCLMIFGSGILSDFVLKASPTKWAIIAIAPTLFFICISSAFRGYFQGYQQMLPTAVSQLLEAVSKLAIGIGLAIYAKNQGYPDHVVAAYAVVGLTIGAGLGMVFLCISKVFFNESKYNQEFLEVNSENYNVDPSSSILKQLAKIALPITISASVMSLTNLIDMVIVQRLLQSIGMSQEEATTIYGNYTTLAVPMFNLPPVLIYPISYSIIPLLSIAKGQGDKARSRNIMESSLRIAVLVGVPCGFGLSALSAPILSLLYTPGSVVMAAPLLRLLAPSTMFVCILSITNAILQSSGYAKKPVISMLAGAVVKILTNFILIRFIGMASTPISTFVCYLTVTCLNFWFVYKYTGLIPNIKKVFLKPFAAGLICAGTAFGIYELLSIYSSSKIITFLSIAVAGIVYLISIFLIKAVTIDDILLMPKGEKIAKIFKKLKLIRD